jgi:DNA-binding transcriptional MerR regulator
MPPRPGTRIYKKGVQRDAYAVRLRALGWSLEEIADHLQLSGNPERAAACIRRGLAGTIRVARDEQRQLEVQSLDELERACWIQLKANHVMVSNGRVVRGDDDEPLEDDRFVLEVIDRILKIKDRRAKLLGLDAPTRTEVLTIDSVESEIIRLEAELRDHRLGTGS